MDLKAAVAAVIAGPTTTAATGVPRGVTTVVPAVRLVTEVAARPEIAVDGLAVDGLAADGPVAADLAAADAAGLAAVTVGEGPLAVVGDPARTADRFNRS